MIKENFIIDELEKKRILNLHETKTKKLYLMEADGQLKSDYPLCVQDFGEPTNLFILGKKDVKKYNWDGYKFYANYTVLDPKSQTREYFCMGKEPMFGKKQVATLSGKPNTAELGGKLLKVGSSGELVKKIQNRLVLDNHGDAMSVGGNASCGFEIESCDGKFGRGTFNAVKKFQTSAGVKSDGVVGDETYQQLFGGEVDNKSSAEFKKQFPYSYG